MWLNAILCQNLLLFLKEVLKWVFRCSVYMTNDHIVYVTCIYIMRCKAGWSRLGNHNQPDKHNCRWYTYWQPIFLSWIFWNIFYTYCHCQPILLASMFLDIFFKFSLNPRLMNTYWHYQAILLASMFLRSFEGKIFFCGFEQSSVSYIYM